MDTIKNQYTIGIQTRTYNPFRNFVGLEINGYHFKKIYDIFKMINHIYYKLFKKSKWVLENSFFDFGINKIDLLHFFNTLSYNYNTPFVVTFESEMPRYKYFIKSGVRRMAAQECKKLIAMSQNAYDMLDNTLANYPEYKDAIMNKTIILPPSQKILIDRYEQKKLSTDNITFTFIGGHFFRKGGEEMLAAFAHLLDNQFPVVLNIVSKMEKDGWLDTYVTQKNYKNALEIINKYPNKIIHHKEIPNNDVLELLKNTHIGILPSYGESYGYSVLEAQGCGCPTITTDVWALPEINNNDIGWLLNVPKIQWNNVWISDIETSDKKNHYSHILTQQIIDVVKNICKNPKEIDIKGKKSLENIQNNHNPTHNIKVLKEIYNEITGA